MFIAVVEVDRLIRYELLCVQMMLIMGGLGAVVIIILGGSVSVTLCHCHKL